MGNLRTSMDEGLVDTSKFLKLEDDMRKWNKKLDALDQEICEEDEKMQNLKNLKRNLNDERRKFDGFVDETSEKFRSLKLGLDQKNQAIEKLRQNITENDNEIVEVMKTKKSTDTFTVHLEKIAQKSRELECPVCLTMCQPPILRCPLFHLVCKECRPKLSRCGECRQQYEGEDRHRFAES